MSSSSYKQSHQATALKSTSLMLILAASFLVSSLALASDGSPENVIVKPVHRRTSFVPRLGKREQMPVKQKYNQALCSDEYGLDCVRLPENLSYNSRRREEPLLALYNSLIRGINTREGDLIMSPSIVESPLILSGENIDGSNSLDYLDMMAPNLKRDFRAGFDRTLEDIITSSPNHGSKRVAFTPRIGRRR